MDRSIVDFGRLFEQVQDHNEEIYGSQPKQITGLKARTATSEKRLDAIEDTFQRLQFTSRGILIGLGLMNLLLALNLPGLLPAMVDFLNRL